MLSDNEGTHLGGHETISKFGISTVSHAGLTGTQVSFALVKEALSVCGSSGKNAVRNAEIASCERL
jgi:hypothetical protein